MGRKAHELLLEKQRQRRCGERLMPVCIACDPLQFGQRICGGRQSVDQNEEQVLSDMSRRSDGSCRPDGSRRPSRPRRSDGCCGSDGPRRPSGRTRSRRCDGSGGSDGSRRPSGRTRPRWSDGSRRPDGPRRSCRQRGWRRCGKEILISAKPRSHAPVSGSFARRIAWMAIPNRAKIIPEGYSPDRKRRYGTAPPVRLVALSSFQRLNFREISALHAHQAH